MSPLGGSTPFSPFCLVPSRRDQVPTVLVNRCSPAWPPLCRGLYFSWTFWLWPSSAPTEPSQPPFPSFQGIFKSVSVLCQQYGLSISPRGGGHVGLPGTLFALFRVIHTLVLLSSCSFRDQAFSEDKSPWSLKVHQTSSPNFSWDSPRNLL